MVGKTLRIPCVICGSEQHRAITQAVENDQSTIAYECPAAFQEQWNPDLHFLTYIDNIALSPYKFAQMYSFQKDIINEAFSDLRDHGYGKSHSKKRWRALKMDILNICDVQTEAERRFKRTLSDINYEDTEKEGDL
jgi:hypothetical protein